MQIIKKYTTGKISSVKWQPKNYNSVDTFVTGSWDDETNFLSLWHLPELEGEPLLSCKISHKYNINAIEYLSEDMFAVGLGDGSVMLYQHSPSSLSCKQIWKNCHSIKKVAAPCRGLASNGEQVASIGEDGRLIIHEAERTDPLNVFESGGSCSDYAVCFVKAFEVLTANMQGHLRLWDIRTQNGAMATLLSPDQVSIYHMASHPSQQHLVAAGSEAGSLVLWDMRSTSQPLSIIAAHDGPISEVQFHPIKTDHLFTCSMDGKAFHWDASSNSKSSLVTPRRTAKDYKGFETKTLKNSWLSPEIAKGILDTVNLIPTSLLPMNSINIRTETLLAGSDEEALYIIRNVLV